MSIINIIKKYNNFSCEIKATLWFTICNFVLKGISFITVPLFAKYLSTEQYGIVSLYNSYQQILLIFATLELSLGAFQRGILKYKEDIRLFTESIQVLCSCITVVIFFITFLFKDLFVELSDTNITIFSLMFVYFLVQPAYECWINKKRFEYDYKAVIFTTLLFSVSTTVIPLLAVIYLKQTAIIRITFVLLVQILFCTPFYLRNLKIKNIVTNFQKCKEQWIFALNFQLPLIFQSFSFLVLAQSDRIMIGTMVGKSEAALYSVAYSLSNVVIIFQTSINQVLKPWRFKKMESRDYKSIGRITNLILIVLGMLLLIFILIAPEVMRLLFSKNYYESVWTIPPISLSVYFMFLYSVFADIESYMCKTKYIMYASVTSAFINVILNYFGIKVFGYIACGYATLISYIMLACMHYFFMRKSCIESGIYKRIFNYRLVSIISFSFILLMILFVVLYPFLWIRFIILFILLFLFFINRKKIFLTFSLLRNIE